MVAAFSFEPSKRCYARYCDGWIPCASVGADVLEHVADEVMGWQIEQRLIDTAPANHL